ncbi:MAG: hypothetical protein KJ058_07845 [Thermoanaerobaculia bacterium]|nr:hypothetical protein [Thermoanaerobaculia bacterium]
MSDQQVTAKVFLGGLPVEPDVRRLEEKFGVPEVGALLTHRQVEGALGEKYGSTRYRTVTKAWRQHLREENNVELKAVPGIGFKCLGADERLDEANSTGRSVLRKLRKGAQQVESIPAQEVSPAKIGVLDHTRNFFAKVAFAARMERTAVLRAKKIAALTGAPEEAAQEARPS